VGERARTPDDNRQTNRQTDTESDNKGRLELSGAREPTDDMQLQDCALYYSASCSKNQEDKTNLNLLEQEIVATAGPYANLHLDPDTTKPASHHSVFYRPDALPAAQPTASKA